MKQHHLHNATAGLILVFVFANIFLYVSLQNTIDTTSYSLTAQVGGGTSIVCGNGRIDSGERASTCPADVNYLTTRSVHTPLGSGTLYYVQTNGDDSNDGMTPETAWKTIRKANGVLQAGDTVSIGGGTYSGSENLIAPTANGNVGNPITYLAQDGEVVYVNSGRMPLDEKKYITVSGINMHVDGIAQMVGSEHIIIENGEFRASGFPVIQMRRASYNTFRNNLFIGTNDTYQDFFEVYTNSHHNLWEYNRFEQSSHVQISMYGSDGSGTGQPHHNIVRGNYFLNDFHTCVGGIRGVNTTLYEDNFFEKCGAGMFNDPQDTGRTYNDDSAGDSGYTFQTPQSHGIWRFNTVMKGGSKNFGLGSFAGSSSYYVSSYHTVTDNAVYHNNFYRNYSSAFVLGPHVRDDRQTAGLAYGDNVFKNNIIFDNMQYISSDTIAIDYFNYYPDQAHKLSDPSGDEWAGNIIESSGLKSIRYPIGSGEFTVEEAEQGIGGLGDKISFHQNKVGDPGFTNPTSFNFSINSSSIAADGGVCLTTVKNSGSGTSVGVYDARYFVDGWGIVSPDSIQIGNDVVSVSSVDYGSDAMIINSSISFSAGECVSFPYSGSTPDIGAFEYGGFISSSPTPTPTNQPPSVSITSPSHNSSFQPGTPIVITASASDADGSVGKVEFFRGSTLLGEDTSSPYQYTWTNAPAGSYTLTAKATDNSSAQTTSLGISISISTTIPSPTPIQTTFFPNQEILASVGTLVAPLITSADNGYVWTNTEDQGIATYRFSISTPGNYQLQFTSITPDSGKNSFYVGWDEDILKDSYHTTDLHISASPLTSFISLRGNGTFDNNQFNPMMWNLSSGIHTLTISGREAGTQLLSLKLVLVTPSPTPSPSAQPSPTPTQVVITGGGGGGGGGGGPSTGSGSSGGGYTPPSAPTSLSDLQERIRTLVSILQSLFLKVAQQKSLISIPLLSTSNPSIPKGVQTISGSNIFGPATTPSGHMSAFSRNLTIGSQGEDVRQLQIFLNSKGFLIATSGPGSPNQESTLFGQKTRTALAKYQSANNIAPATGYFGPLTRTYIIQQMGR